MGQGAQLRPLPTDILRATYKISQELYAEISAKSPSFKKIFDHQMAFHRESQPWWGISDLTYDYNLTTAMQAGWEKG